MKNNKNGVRKHKSTIFWEERFMPLLTKQHGNHSKNVFHRLMKKSSTLRSSLKIRSREYEVKFDISLKDIRNLFLRAYGNSCKYCTRILDVRNMVCDHIVPLSSGGPSIKTNCEIICNRCNTRKGPLTSIEYLTFINCLNKLPEHVSSYIYRKLSGKEMF